MKEKIKRENPETLIFDIETKVTRGRRNKEEDEIKLFAYYSYKYDDYGLLEDLDEIQEIIDDHKILVGFNIKDYDNPILQANGINIQYKIFIDLYLIILKRASQIKIKKGILNNLLERKSLDFMTRVLGLVDDSTAKMKLSDDWFYEWRDEEVPAIRKYAIRDIEVTMKLYEWLESYFWSFRDFINDEDIRKKVYIKDSMTKVAVKAVCHSLGWEERYNWDVDTDALGPKIGGGFTAFPATHEVIDEDIYCMDFNSLYNWIMVMCNIFDRHKGGDTTRPLFEGSEELRFAGKYYADKLGPVGALQTKWYEDRLELKKIKDPKEYCLKIFLNILYGALDAPWYLNTYDKIGANDTTSIGRQFTILARKMFIEAGYRMIYTDTDSVYFVDPFKDKERMLKVKDDIMKKIKSLVPFPSPHFDMGDEEEKDPIRSMYFFKSKKIDTKDNPFDEDDAKNMKLGLMKKNYIYVKQSGAIKIKNLGIVKKSTSKLSKKIFWEKLVPLIVNNQKVQFKKPLISKFILDELNQNMEIIALRKDVKPFSYYKENSPNSLPGQISKRYGEGVHSIIVNNKFGAGKNKRYCLFEEFKEKNMKINDLILDNVYNELSYFTIKTESRSLLDWRKVKDEKN